MVYLYGCASISMPTGGPKDNTPPTVVSTSPKQNQINVNTKKIIIRLSEKVDVSKLKDKIIISPYYGDKYEVETKGKNLIINMKDSLWHDYTYNINISNGICDITEGNCIKNFDLSFSTGQNIDTLNINGYVTDNYTKARIPNALVALYKENDTLDITKHYPTYLCYTNTYGGFAFSNLKRENYYLYAIIDKKKNMLFDSREEHVGFITNAFSPTDVTDSINLETSRSDLNKPKLLNHRNDTEYRLIFNKGILKYSIDSATVKLWHELDENKKEIIFYKNELCEDTIKIKMSVTDSSYNDTLYTVKLVMNPPKKFKTYDDIIKNISPKSNYTITDSLPLIIETKYPVVSAKDSSIIISVDSVSFKYMNLLKDFSTNSANTRFTYTYYRTPKKDMYVIIPKSRIYTNINDTNKYHIVKYSVFDSKNVVKETENENKVNVIINTKVKNYIVQLLNKENNVVREDFNRNRIDYKELDLGKYSIRIIDDENNNKRWDTGNYKTRKQPERIEVYKNIIDIRKNWELEDVEITF